jgi:hypothetical protein
MRIPAALMTLALFTVPASAAGACATASPADIQVRTPPMEVAFQQVADPVRYAPFPKAMESSLGPGWTINGLTVVKPLVKTQIFTADTKADGKACVWVTKVNVSFGFFEPANIYVSNRYKPGTCEFETIRNHENQHVGIHVNTRLKHVPLMRDKVQAALAKLGPVAAADIPAATARIQAIVSDAVDDGLKGYRIESGTLSGMIDSTDSYLSLQSQCSNW